MIDLVKKTLLAGVGAAVVTKEKVESALDEFVAQGRVSSTEARAMAAKIADQGRQEFETLSRQLSDSLREKVARFDKVNRERIDALEKRVAELERANAGQAASAADSTRSPGV